MIALAAMFLATAALMAFVPLTQSIGTVSEPAASQTHPSS
jgi:hypothetical protein